MYIDVLPTLRFNHSFTYKTESDQLKIGDVIKIPFRKKEVWGLVLKINSDLPINVAPEKIRVVSANTPILNLNKHLITFIEAIASYNLASSGLVLKAFTGPLALLAKLKSSAKAKQQSIELSKFNLKKLGDEQQKVTDQILQINRADQHSVTLLEGVTGSGKTEVYFHLIAEALKNPSAQILILLPEIALTSQIISRFKEQFGFELCCWHSKITPKNRREIFLGILSGETRVLIGARSALLLPFPNLKLIIVDEEHDSSYKQQDGFHFNARDMAVLRAKLENFSAVLSSATPSLESYANAVSGKYHHFRLAKKFGSQTREIRLIDLRERKLASGKFISDVLLAEITKNLAAKKQTLLFLNRRGYAPVSLCKACGRKIDCPNCSAYLTHHKKSGRLICHYCGESHAIYSDCKLCGAKNSIIGFGVGVEKIEEELKDLIKDAQIALINSDTVTSFEDAAAVVEKISTNQIDIIIGTQMIAKGYDFPNLTLVGVIDCDSGLYANDLRAAERFYQLLTQVTGRTARSDSAGLVYIQTYQPENLLLKKILSANRAGNQKEFYDFELASRQRNLMPPFTRMAKITISAFEQKLALTHARKLISRFREANKQIEILGPAPAQLHKFKNRFHYQLFLKAEKKLNLQKLITKIFDGLEQAVSQIKISIDIDPL